MESVNLVYWDTSIPPKVVGSGLLKNLGLLGPRRHGDQQTEVWVKVDFSPGCLPGALLVTTALALISSAVGPIFALCWSCHVNCAGARATAVAQGMQQLHLWHQACSRSWVCLGLEPELLLLCPLGLEPPSDLGWIQPVRSPTMQIQPKSPCKFDTLAFTLLLL